MKNILTAITLIFAVHFFAQKHDIIKHNGEKIEVNFIKVDENLVYYAPPNCMEECKISCYAVAQITGKTNNTPKVISQKINFTEKADYKNVINIKESEAIGLKKSEDLSSYLSIAKGETRLPLTQNGEKRMKQDAALRGLQFIVITSIDKDKINRVAYTY